MIKVSVWCRRGAFLEAPALYCSGCVGLLPGAIQNAGVCYWRPVWKVLALCLPQSWLVLGWKLWHAGETNILNQSDVNSMQIGHAVWEAQEKPSVSFL